MTEALPRGGDPFHNAYAASLGLVEVRVDINDTPPCPPFTGGKRSKQFDGSVGPPIVLIDVKTRMGGLRFPRVHSDVYHSKAVADYCGAGFLIAIENKESAEVWRENFPDNINISHVPWGGDFP